ncbi:uncharacterized protein LOC112271918 isoform X1 [Brachypodium distachyon]|uniref:uncharacterized protein LOC112271918 isoform X1 n=1 Tax=Brachypodium distachyon TaxID=15368 RepID=UPI000D0DC83E|nr:uncharacterized protein LOC112271918 isoform X1 [Brachypodium distachyon]|eukprot:XP_024317942.1 uncharacterized protein LOC112271918 isoform X1 [Brachypodium distachyon]
MEFSLRGPATGDDHRFPDPPPHGEQEPKLVMRDALLSQLHMACLRREIIEAELAEIERAVALRAATGGHQAQTTPMADADAGRPFSTNQPMAQQNPEFDEHKLPDSDKGDVATVVQPRCDRPLERWEDGERRGYGSAADTKGRTRFRVQCGAADDEWGLSGEGKKKTTRHENKRIGADRMRKNLQRWQDILF